MSEHKVTIKDKDFTIPSPSLDKAMRLTDYVSEIIEDIPEIFKDIENFQEEYKSSHREILTLEDWSNAEYKQVFKALNIKKADFDNQDNLVTDEIAGKTGIAFYHSASQAQILMHVFPKAWKAARGNIVELCALVITTDGELEEHDKRGAINGLLEQKSHFVKYNCNIEDMLNILSVALILVKEQIESASSSLGKVTENMSAMMSAGTQMEETQEEQEKKETQKDSNDEQQ